MCSSNVQTTHQNPDVTLLLVDNAFFLEVMGGNICHIQLYCNSNPLSDILATIIINS
jgi:hypothetical protein